MAQWKRSHLKIDIPKEITNTIQGIQDILTPMSAALSALSALLDIVKIFLVGFLNPVYALAKMLADDIKAFLEAFAAAGVYMCLDFLDVTVMTPAEIQDNLLGGMPGFKNRMNKAFFNPLDNNKPVFPDSADCGGWVFMFHFTAISEALAISQSVAALWNVTKEAGAQAGPSSFGVFPGSRKGKIVAKTFTARWTNPTEALNTPSGYYIEVTNRPPEFRFYYSVTTITDELIPPKTVKKDEFLTPTKTYISKAPFPSQTDPNTPEPIPDAWTRLQDANGSDILFQVNPRGSYALEINLTTSDPSVSYKNPLGLETKTKIKLTEPLNAPVLWVRLIPVYDKYLGLPTPDQQISLPPTSYLPQATDLKITSSKTGKISLYNQRNQLRVGIRKKYSENLFISSVLTASATFAEKSSIVTLDSRVLLDTVKASYIDSNGQQQPATTGTDFTLKTDSTTQLTSVQNVKLPVNTQINFTYQKEAPNITPLKDVLGVGTINAIETIPNTKRTAFYMWHTFSGTLDLSEPAEFSPEALATDINLYAPFKDSIGATVENNALVLYAKNPEPGMVLEVSGAGDYNAIVELGFGTSDSPASVVAPFVVRKKKEPTWENVSVQDIIPLIKELSNLIYSYTTSLIESLKGATDGVVSFITMIQAKIQIIQDIIDEFNAILERIKNLFIDASVFILPVEFTTGGINGFIDRFNQGSFSAFDQQTIDDLNNPTSCCFGTIFLVGGPSGAASYQSLNILFGAM